MATLAVKKIYYQNFCPIASTIHKLTKFESTSSLLRAAVGATIIPRLLTTQP
jgi:hypothetical protein